MVEAFFYCDGGVCGTGWYWWSTNALLPWVVVVLTKNAAAVAAAAVLEVVIRCLQRTLLPRCTAEWAFFRPRVYCLAPLESC